MRAALACLPTYASWRFPDADSCGDLRATLVLQARKKGLPAGSLLMSRVNTVLCYLPLLVCFCCCVIRANPSSALSSLGAISSASRKLSSALSSWPSAS
jgi:hypothetical protein